MIDEVEGVNEEKYIKKALTVMLEDFFKAINGKKSILTHGAKMQVSVSEKDKQLKIHGY